MQSVSFVFLRTYQQLAASMGIVKYCYVSYYPILYSELYLAIVIYITTTNQVVYLILFLI